MQTTTQRMSALARQATGSVTDAIEKGFPSKKDLRSHGEKAIASVSDTATAVSGAISDTVKNASPWAIAGGLIVGVGAIAAAPFTGGGSVVGGVTLLASLSGAGAAAAAAGGVGAAVGAAVSSSSKNRAQEDAFRQGREAGAAEYLAKVHELEQHLAQAAATFREHNQFNAFIVCLIAVGAAMAACDGHVHELEQEHLREFVVGLSVHALPSTVQETVERLIASPPTFDEATQYVETLGQAVWPLIDGLLAVVSEADGEVTGEELAFLQSWETYKGAREGGQ